MIRWLLASALLVISAAPAEAIDRRAFQREFGAFSDTLAANPNAPPGFAVMVAEGDRVLFERAYGVRDFASGAPMTLDTPLISASITKSYIALLAARMDAEGVLSLEATIADVWPQLTLPAPLDPRAVTVRRLLSHTSGMQDQWLDIRSITAGEVSLADVPGHLSRFATTTEPGFQYSNFGAFLYSMMLEEVTGRPWRELLEEKIFRPMRLRRTSFRLTDLPQDQLGACHARQQGNWVPLPQQDASTLNAAGGVHASVRDASRFVRAFARGRGVGGMNAALFARTWAEETPQGEDLLGFERYAYGLGWDLTRYEGAHYVSRSGGYPGCRSLIIFSPASGVSVTVFAAGDFGANLVLFNLAKQAFDIAAGRADAPRTETRLAQFNEQIAAAIARRDAVDFPDLSRPVDAARIAPYVGTFASDQLGDIVFTTAPNGLAARWGVFDMILLPGEGDAFTGYPLNDEEALAFRFERDAAGRVNAVRWDDLALTRTR